MRKRLLALLLPAALAAVTLQGGAVAQPANAQEVPRQIRFLVGFTPGGATDLLARRMQPLFEQRGYQFVVENAPGAGSTIALARLAQARADGSTLGFASCGLIDLVAREQTQLRMQQFTNIIRVAEDRFVFAVGRNSPIRTIDEAIAAMRGARGAFSAGSAGPEGGLASLHMNYFASAIGATYVYVAFPGASRVANELIGGHLGAGHVKPADIFGQIRSGDVRPVFVFGRERIRQLPDVPALAEHGITHEDEKVGCMSYVVGPAGMAPALRDRMAMLFRDIIMSPEFQAGSDRDAVATDGLGAEALDTAVMEMFAAYRNAFLRTR
ncbi:MAG: Bug family tripartite tricarboxylate transporter substrate binding protein [Alphaproteobacteria bacterium]